MYKYMCLYYVFKKELNLDTLDSDEKCQNRPEIGDDARHTEN
jgi:hypothetical protein